MARAGEMKTVEDFIVPVPGDVDPAAITTAVVWRESLGRLNTAAKHR